MTLKEIKQLLQTANLYQISKATGVTWQTLYNLKKGKTDVLRSMTKEKLQNYFQEKNNA